MVLKLDPRVPLVWRTPDALQLGVDRPLAVIDNVRLSEQRMIAALVAGTSRSGLLMTGVSSGATEEEVAALLVAVQPAIIDTEAFPTGPAAAVAGAVAIDGDGTTACRLADIIRVSGYETCWWPPAQEDPTRRHPAIALAVIVSDFVIAPDRYGTWLRRDIPHLPIVFGDRTVRIGPLVVPGAGPCLFCLEKARVELDPAWPAIASQLLGRRAPTDRPLIAAEVAALAGRIVCNALREMPSAYSTASLQLDADTGQVTAVQHRPHAGCGCRALPENVTLLEEVRAAARCATTTSATADAP